MVLGFIFHFEFPNGWLHVDSYCLLPVENQLFFRKVWRHGSKSLIFCTQQVQFPTRNFSKNLNSNRKFPEVTGEMVWPEIEKFRDRKSKIRFLQSQEKTITRVLFLFFDIWSWDSGRGLWSLISGDDVITGSCSEQLFVYEFWDFRVYTVYCILNSILNSIIG